MKKTAPHREATFTASPKRRKRGRNSPTTDATFGDKMKHYSIYIIKPKYGKSAPHTTGPVLIPPRIWMKGEFGSDSSKLKKLNTILKNI